MGLFDFLKPRPAPAPEPAATLEALLAQAARDPAFQPEFYRRLLLEPLVVLTGKDPASTEPQTWVSGPDESLEVRTWDGDRVPVFTSPERIYDGQVMHEQVVIITMKGRDLLNMLRGKTLFLNPFSDYGKELLPAEVERLLAGTVLDTGRTITVKKATEVLIGQPAAYPAELVQALARLLTQQPRVRAAYLGWLHNPASPEPPHYLICLDVEGEMRAISQQVGYVAQQFLKPQEIIDIVQLGPNGFADYFLTTKPFYER